MAAVNVDVLSGARPVTFRLGRRALLAVAYLVALIPALGMAFAQPVWQLTDEAQHYDMLAQYAHGVYPVEGQTTLRQETVDVMKLTGVYRWSPADTQPLPEHGDADTFTAPPSYLSGYKFQLWVRRHIWWFSYEAMQPPLFYALATPVWMLADKVGGPFDAVFAVRVLNALLLALLAPLALLLAWRLVPRTDVAVASAAVLLATPGLALNGSQITNDTLAAVLGAATVLAAIGLAQRPRPRWAVLAGVALGLLLNLGAYGHPVPNAEVARLMGAATSGASYTFAQSLDYCLPTFWTGEHMNTVPLTGLMAAACVPFTLAGFVGLQRLPRGHGR